MCVPVYRVYGTLSVARRPLLSVGTLAEKHQVLSFTPLAAMDVDTEAHAEVFLPGNLRLLVKRPHRQRTIESGQSAFGPGP